MNKFDQFLKNRQSLIDQYTKGDLTKDEFIEANYVCINSLDIQPFRKIDNEKNVFSMEERKSLIDSYINQKY